MTGPSSVSRRVDLGQALSAVLRRYVQAAHATLSGLPGGPRGYQVLSIAGEGRCSNQAAIASVLGIDRTVMTYLVDDLEAAGLVERRPDPADRRARQVVLRPAGEELLQTTADRLEDVERTVLAGLGDDDAATFTALLARLTSGEEPDHSACSGEAPTC